MSATYSFAGFIKQITDCLTFEETFEEMIYEGTEPFCEDVTTKKLGLLRPRQTKYMMVRGKHLEKGDGGIIKTLERAISCMTNGHSIATVERIEYVVFYYGDEDVHHRDIQKWFPSLELRSEEKFEDFWNFMEPRFNLHERDMKTKKNCAWSPSKVDTFKKHLKTLWLEKFVYIQKRESIDDDLRTLGNKLSERFPHLDTRLELCINQILGCHVLLQVKGTWTSYEKLNDIIEGVAKNDPTSLVRELLESPQSQMLPEVTNLACRVWMLPVFEPTTKDFLNLCNHISVMRRNQNRRISRDCLEGFYALIVHIQSELLTQNNDPHLWAFTYRYTRGVLCKRTDAKWDYLSTPGKKAMIHVKHVITAYAEICRNRR